MEKIPYRKYIKEFREEAVKLVENGGLSIKEAARRLSTAPSTLANWVKAFKAGKLSDIGKNHKVPGFSGGILKILHILQDFHEIF